MRYHNITKDDMLNGDGLRTVLWVAGCCHGCKGCQNPVTWDIEGGLPFDGEARAELFAELEKPYISGVTLSGGDPLHPANREETGALMKEMKERFPDKTIWLYTGYDWFCRRAGRRPVCGGTEGRGRLLAGQHQPESHRRKEIPGERKRNASLQIASAP